VSHLKNLTLKVWRQSGPTDKGHFENYTIDEISDEASFLEMLDVLNEGLINENKEAVVFDHDCREGICGTCSLMINGVAHGPQKATTTCQLHMRTFKSGDTIVIEPWRATAFPIIKDLMVDRGAFDRIIESGGFITAATGGAPDANLIPIPKPVADAAMDSAACIGCGACVAACPNGAASLFTAAKISHLNFLPQGQSEPRFHTSTSCHKVSPNALSARKQWSKRWMNTLVHAQTTANVLQHARRKSLLMSSH